MDDNEKAAALAARAREALSLAAEELGAVIVQQDDDGAFAIQAPADIPEPVFQQRLSEAVRRHLTAAGVPVREQRIAWEGAWKGAVPQPVPLPMGESLSSLSTAAPKPRDLDMPTRLMLGRTARALSGIASELYSVLGREAKPVEIEGRPDTAPPLFTMPGGAWSAFADLFGTIANLSEGGASATAVMGTPDFADFARQSRDLIRDLPDNAPALLNEVVAVFQPTGAPYRERTVWPVPGIAAAMQLAVEVRRPGEGLLPAGAKLVELWVRFADGDVAVCGAKELVNLSGDEAAAFLAARAEVFA